jgi:hypothetical protein
MHANHVFNQFGLVRGVVEKSSAEGEKIISDPFVLSGETVKDQRVLKIDLPVFAKNGPGSGKIDKRHYAQDKHPLKNLDVFLGSGVGGYARFLAEFMPAHRRGHMGQYP